MNLVLDFEMNDAGMYEATASGITGCFNIHLEAERYGLASLYMRTSGDAYAKVKDQVDITESDVEGVYCGEGEEFGLVFEKDIKIVSNVPITTGIITVADE